MKSIGSRLSKIFVLFVLFALIMAICLFGVSSVAASAENSASYYSKTAAPIIYGATKIVLGSSAVQTFDYKDARFRTFGRDFEDGDITLTATGDTHFTPEAGHSYNIRYTARDSHGNETTLDVPITVDGENPDKITVERTVYGIANDEYMALSRTNRNNNGDRQILGIFLTGAEKVEARVPEGETRFTVAFLNDDSRTEHSEAFGGAEFTEIYNKNHDGNVPSNAHPKSLGNVPLLFSPKLSKGADLRTTYKIEIRYDKTVKELNYFHQGDDEQAFKEKWRKGITDTTFVTQNEKQQDVTVNDRIGEYGVVEGNYLMLLIPPRDIDANTTYQFSSYDEHLSYYQSVVEKMDEIIGLSFDPEEPTDQNVRAKYLVKANANGAGAAYYSGNHVGINNRSMGAFFQMNWGGLHEIGHGYQGLLGSGTMGIGEASNNILGHYIQMDENIWKVQSNGKALQSKWLGNLENCEDKWNKHRIAGDGFNSKYYGENPGGKLYALINLLDAFDGWESYAKIFKYLRKGLAEGSISTSNFSQEDFFAEALYDLYDVNIAPYWNQWGLSVSEEVAEEIQNAPREFSILADSAGDMTDEIMTGEGKTRKFAPVSDEVLKEYGIKSDLEVAVEIEDGAAENKTVLLQKQGDTEYQGVIRDGKATFSDVDAGSYFLVMPVVKGYSAQNSIVTLNAGKNETSVRYEIVPDGNYHPTTLRLAGYWGNSAYELALSDRNKKGRILLYPANVGNQYDNYWSTEAAKDEIYVSVTISDADGNQIDCREVRGNGYFTLQSSETADVEFEYGARVDIYTHQPGWVHVKSQITGQDMPAYDAVIDRSNYNMSFIITEVGFEPVGNEEFSAEDALYEVAKDNATGELEELKAYFEGNDDNLDYKYKDRAKKAEFLEKYEALREEDKEPYRALAQSIEQGGKPIVTVLQEQVTLETLALADWNEILSAVDNEDGQMTLGGDMNNIGIVGYDGGAGEYNLTVTVYDSDGNGSVCNVQCTVLNAGTPPTDPEPEPENPGDPEPPTEPEPEDPGDPEPENPTEPETPSEHNPAKPSIFGIGAIIGIAVGCAAAVAAVVAVVLIVLKKKRKS